MRHLLTPALGCTLSHGSVMPRTKKKSNKNARQRFDAILWKSTKRKCLKIRNVSTLEKTQLIWHYLPGHSEKVHSCGDGERYASQIRTNIFICKKESSPPIC
mmetsp:Transcript_9228/g.14309  ORF Transcript_9228/g.14309 Transcript_9228/m.14309 type:complete len:102 (-) Transcript_9228:35-340(-)